MPVKFNQYLFLSYNKLQIKMKILTAQITLLLLILPLALQAGPFRRHFLNATTNSNPRTNTLYARCPVPRVPFFSSQFSDAQSVARKQTGAALKLDGDQLIYNYLKKNESGVSAELNKSMGQTIMYVIFMAIGLLLMLILGPILICCCCKPEKCPPCLKCRAPQGHIYSNCERKWPAVATIILAVIVIGTMIAVLAVNPRLQKGYSETRCSTAIFFDDLLNGNYTADGKEYWVGLKPLQGSLTTLQTGLQNTLNTVSNFKDESQILGYLVDQLKGIKHDVSDIPQGDGSSSELHLSYVSPLNTPPQSTSPMTTSISSTFPLVLGSNTSSFSLVGQTYTGLSMAQHTLQSLNGLSALINAAIPKLTQSMNSGFEKYASLVVKAQSMDQETDAKMETYQKTIVSPLSIFIYILAALVIVAAIVLIIASLMICLKDKIACTKVLYGSCTVLTLAGIIFFILSIAMSAGTAGTHYGCSYVEVGLKNKTEFVKRFEPIFNNTLLTQMVAECASKQGSGIIVNTSMVSSVLANMHEAVKHLNEISTDNLVYLTNTSKVELTHALRSYHRAEALDIDSVSDIQILEKLSNPRLYGCSAPGFASDSWIPSASQDGIYVSCKASSDHVVTKDTCQQEQFQARSPGCTGCIDSFSIFSEFDSYDEVLGSLKKRYSSPDCMSFNQELANVWYNFYKKKRDTLGPAQQRASNISDRIDHLNQFLHQKFEQDYKAKLFHLQLNIQTITDPTQPPVAKIDCKVLGEDVELIVNTACTQIFNYTFSMRVLSIIAGFALLGVMIFATFFGVRAWNTIGKDGEGQALRYGDGQGEPTNRPVIEGQVHL